MTFNNTATAGTSGITNSGGLQFNNSSTAGSADITNQNGGAITFNNSATAGSAIIGNQSGATIDFFNTSSAGSSQITNASGATITFHDTSTAGTTATIGNAGTLTFNDTSSAGGATITNSGTSSTTFNNSATAGTSAITLNGTSTLSFNNSSSGGNAVIINNTGTVTFNDTSTAGSANITINAGALNFNNTATAGTATIGNSGSMNFNNGADAGTSNITNQPLGIITFRQTSSANGATVANAGVVIFQDASTAANSTITTSNGGETDFVGTASGGTARFITNAGGFFDMSGLTTAGTTAGSIEGAGHYFLGSKTLTVGSNNLSTTVSGVISDGGTSGGAGASLTKVGTGALTLTNTETYTGATTVNGGTLVVDGSIALSTLTTANAGATLSGSGIVGNTAITGGTLAPGSTVSDFGPLTVTGTLSFTAASTYMIQVSSTNAGRTNVSGTATLGNATVNVNYLSTTLQKQYTILNSTTGVSGTFNPTVVSNNSNITSTLTYDANNVFLNAQLNFTPPSGPNFPNGLSINQQNVANALTGFFNRTGSIPMAFAALSPQGLTIASGELGTGVIQTAIKATDLFLNLLLDPTIAGRSGGFTAQSVTPTGYADEEALAYAAKRAGTATDAFAMATKAPPLAPLHQWSVWASGYGGSETVGGNAVVGSQDLTARIWGVASGADYKISPDTLVGFALGGGGTNYSLANAMGGGRTDMFNAGFYGRQNFGAAYLSGAFAYGWHDVTTNRTVPLAGVDMLQGRFQAETFSGRFEGGYRFATPFGGITPYAAAQVISVQSAELFGSEPERRRTVRAELRGADHDRHPHRTRPARRHILRDVGRRADAARPRRLGA